MPSTASRNCARDVERERDGDVIRPAAPGARAIHGRERRAAPAAALPGSAGRTGSPRRSGRERSRAARSAASGCCRARPDWRRQDPTASSPTTTQHGEQRPDHVCRAGGTRRSAPRPARPAQMTCGQRPGQALVRLDAPLRSIARVQRSAPGCSSSSSDISVASRNRCSSLREVCARSMRVLGESQHVEPPGLPVDLLAAAVEQHDPRPARPVDDAGRARRESSRGWFWSRDRRPGRRAACRPCRASGYRP